MGKQNISKYFKPKRSIAKDTDDKAPAKSHAARKASLASAVSDHLDVSDLTDDVVATVPQPAVEDEVAVVDVVEVAPMSPDAMEEALRQFDLTYKYGPCAGMTRLARWERAQAFGMSPPPEVPVLLRRLAATGTHGECVWHGRV